MAANDSSETVAAHPEPNYMMIWLWLLILTVAEVGLVLIAGIPRVAVVAGLVGMALSKAILVAAFFMHLKFETRTLAIIAGIPMILCTFLLFMLLPDAMV